MTAHRSTRPQVRPGFTLLSLLIVIAILAFVVSISLPSLCRAREQSNRIKCASNLRQIGQSIELYRQVNNGKLPRTIADESENPTPAFFTNPAAPDPFGPGGPEANDLTAALYLLVRAGDLSEEVFICPSSQHERGMQDPLTTSNFTTPWYLSADFSAGS